MAIYTTGSISNAIAPGVYILFLSLNDRTAIAIFLTIRLRLLITSETSRFGLLNDEVKSEVHYYQKTEVWNCFPIVGKKLREHQLQKEDMLH